MMVRESDPNKRVIEISSQDDIFAELLSQNLLNNVGFFDSGQPLIEPLKLHAKPLVVKSEQMKDCCM